MQTSSRRIHYLCMRSLCLPTHQTRPTAFLFLLGAAALPLCCFVLLRMPQQSRCVIFAKLKLATIRVTAAAAAADQRISIQWTSSTDQLVQALRTVHIVAIARGTACICAVHEYPFIQPFVQPSLSTPPTSTCHQHAHSLNQHCFCLSYTLPNH